MKNNFFAMESLRIDLTSYLYVEVVLVTLSLVYIYIKIKRREFVKYGEQIPGEKGLPIIGNADRFFGIRSLTEALETYLATARKFTDEGIERLWFGPTLVVALWEPEHIEVVANSPYTTNKGPVYGLAFGEFASGVFTTYGGRKWKELRKPLTKSLVKKYLDRDYLKIFINKSNEFRDFIIQNREGKYIDVKEDVAALSMDIFSETHLGLEANEVRNRQWNYTKLIDDVFYVSVTSCLKYAFLTWRNMAKYSKFGQKVIAIKEKKAALMKWIYEERKKYTKPRDETLEFYTDFLLRRAAEKKFTTEDLYRELTDVFVAGTDTSAVTVSTALLFLAMFPEIQEDVYNELLTIFGDSDRDPTPEDLSNMQCLGRVVKEVIRIITPPGILKISTGKVQLGKYTIPTGTILFVFTYRLHRDPRYWERPNSFYPDHFLPEKEKARARFAYIPFGIGPRICPGFQYGINSVLVIVSTLLRAFKLSTELKYEDIKYDYTLLLCCRNGYPVKFERRK